jgi:hypothetical protein
MGGPGSGRKKGSGSGKIKKIKVIDPHKGMVQAADGI